MAINRHQARAQADRRIEDVYPKALEKVEEAIHNNSLLGLERITISSNGHGSHIEIPNFLVVRHILFDELVDRGFELKLTDTTLTIAW